MTPILWCWMANKKRPPPPYKKWLPLHIYIDKHWIFHFLLIILRVENLNSNQTKPLIYVWLVSQWPLYYGVRRPTKKRPPPPYKKWLHWHIYIDEHWNFPLYLIIIWVESLNSNQTKPPFLTWFTLTWPLWHAVRRPPKKCPPPPYKNDSYGSKVVFII